MSYFITLKNAKSYCVTEVAEKINSTAQQLQQQRQLLSVVL